MEPRELEANAKKRPYTAPLLVEFGSVVKLTGA
jgi:hypothetical protein